MKIKLRVIGKTRNDGAVISDVGVESQEAADRQKNQLRMLYGDRNIEITIEPVKKETKKS